METTLRTDLMIGDICAGTEDEIKAWYKTINIAGLELTKQEISNAIYSGAFVTAVKKIFSNSTNYKLHMWRNFVRGDVKRQELLRTALGLDWGRLYDTYHEKIYDADEIAAEVDRLYADDTVKNKRGIFEYVLSGGELTRLLHVRYFEESVIKTVYARQTQTAKVSGKSNCPLCAAGKGSSSHRIWERKDMDADHVTAWSAGGVDDGGELSNALQTAQPRQGQRVMIYVHIPFCRSKCNYCAFNSKVGGADERAAYVAALAAEIERRGDNSAVETIYFGGGTPTTLTLSELERIVAAVRKNFRVEERAEITIEANPGTVDENYLRGLKTLGFNRLSLGVQTFDDALLKIIGRIHSSHLAAETVAAAKKFFGNVSVDLMYGLPTQTLEGVRRDVERATALGVEHVSIYGLEVEEGTIFFELAREGELALPDENTCADMYDFITTTLPALGYRRYEISNFARGNFISRHNVGYWTGKKYFGFGAGAHGFDGGLRTANVRDVATYIERIGAGESVCEVEEVVTRREAMEEFCFLGLRMTDGIDARTFAKNFGTSIFAVFGAVIERNRRLGLLRVDGDRIALTSRGMSLGNEVFADFLL